MARSNNNNNRTPNGTGNKKHDAAGTEDDEFHIKMSNRFIVLCLLSCTLLAYAVGRTAKTLLIDEPNARLLASLQGGMNERVMKLPNPVLKNKPIPNTIYTSMNFDTARSSTINSRWVVMEGHEIDQVEAPALNNNETCDANDESCSTCSRGKETNAAPATPQEEDEEEHLPAGQHLLMDIRNVDQSFLASEERLATAMLDVVGDCGLTLLSYHCHGLQPSGVSCVGVLLESHVSFHTWPSQGVITLDLFTCGANSLLPIVEATERLFGIPANSDGPETVWAYKVRGFGDATEEELADLFTFPIGTMTEYKREMVSITKKTTEMKRNRIDVYDVLRPVYQSYDSYKKSLKNDGSYESQYKDIFQPDRILFVNGAMQSRRSAEVPYHEALVHPGMFAHDSPQRVLLLGCGGGAALREVLKHKTVEQVVMIEEEKHLVDIARKFFPEYADCSGIAGVGNRDCFKDARVELVYSDLFDWVEKQIEDGTQNKFDVIILDDQYYIDGPREYGDFVTLISKLISDKGVLAAQMGEAPALDWPTAELSEIQNRYKFVQSLLGSGFTSVVDYEEGHLGFAAPWQFVVAFRDDDMSRGKWFGPSSWFDLAIKQRTQTLHNGDSSLQHFDGAVMQEYAHPSKASEFVFCQGTPISVFEACHRNTNATVAASA